MIKVHGVVTSRALRTLWMLEELGLPYEQVPTTFRGGGTRTPEHLALNPNGHIPVLQDGHLTLFESMAINLYLASKYGGAQGLWPVGLEDQARCYQWSFWGMLECEGHLLKVLLHRVLWPEERRDPAKAEEGVRELAGPLKVLDGTLAGRDYLLGDTFSVADLNVAAILSWTKPTKMDLSPYPVASQWLGACMGRPGFKSANSKK